LLVDAHDPADAMRRIDDMLAGAEAVSLLWFLLFSHTLVSLSKKCLASDYAWCPELARTLPGSFLASVAQGRSRAQDEPPIRNLIAPTSLKSEKKVRPNRDASLGA
jgi:hypothetical protein